MPSTKGLETIGHRPLVFITQSYSSNNALNSSLEILNRIAAFSMVWQI